MASFFTGLGFPQPHAGSSHPHAAPNPSAFSNTVIAVALSALGFFSASIFDRTDPGLAAIIRCASVGVGLIWLFNRSWPSAGSHFAAPSPMAANYYVGQNYYPSVIPTQTAPNFLNSFSPPGSHGVAPMPINVVPMYNPSSSGISSMHVAPQDRGGRGSSWAERLKKKQAQTQNLQNPNLPGFQPTQQNSRGGSVVPVFPVVQPIRVNTFPNVQRATVQSMREAPQPKGGFPNVVKVSSSQGDGDDRPGNQTLLFAAATNRDK